MSQRHFAVVAPPTSGHINPLQILGAELAAIGHRVTFVHVADLAPAITNPSVRFEPLIRASSTSDTLASYTAKLARQSGPLGFAQMIRATAAITRALLDHAPSAIERIGADALIADSVELAGPLIAERLSLPHIISVTGLPLLEEENVPPPFVGWSYRPDRSGRSRNRGGHAVTRLLMRPITRVIEERRRAWGLSQAGAAPLLYTAQCPRGLDFPRAELPPNFRYGSPWRDGAEQAMLPDDGRPLIFCSLGTLQGKRWRLFAKMARACADTGARAVIGHGGGLSDAEVAALPGDPLVRAFWPQEEVLRACKAAILHGGFNTVLDALAAGVPMIVLPIAFEQPGTAARLARIGAGRVLSPRLLSVRMLSAELRRIMSEDQHRRAAQAIAAEMREAGGARTAAAVISAAFEAAS